VVKAYVYTAGRSLYVSNVVVVLFANIKNVEIYAVIVVVNQSVSTTAKEAVVKNVRL
jgi:hypothetical protein